MPSKLAALPCPLLWVTRSTPQACLLLAFSMGSGEGTWEEDTFLSASCSAASPWGCLFLPDLGPYQEAPSVMLTPDRWLRCCVLVTCPTVSLQPYVDVAVSCCHFTVPGSVSLFFQHLDNQFLVLNYLCLKCLAGARLKQEMARQIGQGNVSSLDFKF